MLVAYWQSEHSGVHEMAVGGAIYISGIIFFKCDGVVPFAHAIWHCFVFLGALVHFSAVCHYLLNPGLHHCDVLCMQFTGWLCAVRFLLFAQRRIMSCIGVLKSSSVTFNDTHQLCATHCIDSSYSHIAAIKPKIKSKEEVKNRKV